MKMGHILEIKKDEEFPADMVLLYAEDGEKNPVDMVFVETINLDGENNLKPWTIIDPSVNSRENFNSYSARIERYDAPNKDLEKWEGMLKKGETSRQGHIDNLLLWGCTLRNTAVAYGLVIYVGRHTKIVKNSKTVPDKLSNIIKTMNKILYSIFTF